MLRALIRPVLVAAVFLAPLLVAADALAGPLTPTAPPRPAAASVDVPVETRGRAAPPAAPAAPAAARAERRRRLARALERIETSKPELAR
jgi:hypothetical protein